MNTVFLVIGAIFIFLAAVFHFYVFFLESVTWTNPRTWRIFGVASQEDAETIRPMAFNQGFYNLFLGLGAGIGLILLASVPAAGFALVFMGAGSMVLAALVLLLSSKTNRRSALIQGAPPLVGIVFILLALAG
ncbi:MAG: epimerase [Microbacteriaceae bacterium]|jgi:putative membrane protein|nr:epimerase [Microbacteriaceae bacterium]